MVTGLCLCLAPVLTGQEPSADDPLKNLEWRAIGPANMGGRVTDIVGIPGDPSTFYFGGADGGVFKTTNGGVTFEALFTDQRSYSVGALAIAPSDHNVVWLGSGEGDPRNSVGYGHGVYRSVDGGRRWEHLGLAKTERIKRIVVHPDDPDVACVCALGREWGPNPERGVFRTTDGGQTWEKVLYVDEDTGCSDLAIDLNNPRFLYAGMWTFRRRPWRFDGGGKETAVYRSRDGGRTWEKIMNGLPEKPMARIGISVAQSQPETVYMITEFPEAGGTLFRSDDRGDNWRLINDDPNINFRPFYYSDIRVDPNNPDHLYSLSGRLYKSTDGGKTFQHIARDVHGDHQSLWIDPLNSQRVLSGSDGGYQVSYDGGSTFDIINNVELSQFYQLYVDEQSPYNVYGGLQDNGTWVGPSNSLDEQGILKRHWRSLAGGDGYYAIPVPGQEHEVYANLQGGVIFHVNDRTGNVRNIHPYPKIIGSAGDAIEDHKYRFNWDSPIHISPHDPNTVYFGGNVVFRSRDKGYNWEEISGDLTTNDKRKQKTSGGAVYQDNTAAEFHCAILTIAESPVQADVIWVGTDDGNVQLTTDGGKSWKNLNKNIKGLPEFAWVAKIHASEHEAGAAFVAVDHHRSDDFRPYAFMTRDFGKTWTKVSDGLPQDDYVKVIRQDPVEPNLLYAGMEHGVFFSRDMGSSWTKLNHNLPPVSVRDLHVQKTENDLVIGTHGRGAWILDDITPLQQMARAEDKAVHLFESRPAVRWHLSDKIENLGQRVYRAKNPKYGAYLNFMLAEKPEAPVKVEIKNSAGDLIRTLEDSTAEAGLNRIVWDLRHQEGTQLDEPETGGWRSGPFRPKAAPGEYTAVLHARGETQETKVTVRPDPRIDMSETDYRAEEDALLGLNELLSQTNKMINHCEQLEEQLGALKKKLGPSMAEEKHKAIAAAIDEALEKVEALENELRRPPPRMTYRQRPRLREEIRSLMWAIDGATARPTASQMQRIEALREETGQRTEQMNQLLLNEITRINKMAVELPQVTVKVRQS